MTGLPARGRLANEPNTSSFGAGWKSPPAVRARERSDPQSLWNPGADSDSLEGRRSRTPDRRVRPGEVRGVLRCWREGEA